ncbi:DUF4097 family beta strand repeat-containing protein [Microlunatus soli]|uniref:Putative adhesin n=1 Tax=Microlunatus soli TaxID=630515 RepID=A0A1H1VG70_9ACTN|nr:DUF4097 family beta strand repeat-containing protein [Microlunatus soli]SDS83386.1 Putative adhesin [Microlunatus soli]
MSEIQFNYDDVTSVRVAGLGSGDVTVHESADGDRSVSGRISGAPNYLERLQINESQGRLNIDFPHDPFGQNADAAVELLMPAGIDLDVTSGSAEIVATVALGATKISNGSGGVDLTAATEARVTTGSGDIVIGDISGAPEPRWQVSVMNSGSGDISVGSTTMPLQTKTASGNVHVLQMTSALRANTASGDIAVPQASGSLELRSASGDISVGIADELPAWLDLSSVSGEVRIDLDASEQPAEGEPYVAIKASTASGDVAVYRA